MRIAQEEIFGPVLSVLRFDDEAEALRLANGTSYGLAASIWTRDVARAHALARRVQAGVVWINCFNEFDDAAPFGGYKESGWGRDLSAHALENYTQLKTVWTQAPGGLSDAPHRSSCHSPVRSRAEAGPGEGGPGGASPALAGGEGRQAGEDRRRRPRRRPARQVRRASTSSPRPPGAGSASATWSSAGTWRTSSTTTRRSPAGTPATPTSQARVDLSTARMIPWEPATAAFLLDFVMPDGSRLRPQPARAPPPRGAAGPDAGLPPQVRRASTSSSSSARPPPRSGRRASSNLEPLDPGNVRLLLAADLAELGPGARAARRLQRLRAGGGGLPHRDRPRGLRDRDPLRRCSRRRGTSPSSSSRR